MNYHSKKSLISIIISLIVFVYLYLNFIQEIHRVDICLTPQLWARFYFKLIIIYLVLKILILLVFNIINTKITKEKVPLISDERDRLIELKVTRNYACVFCFGFFIAMGVLIISQSLSMMFNIIAFVILISGLVVEASNIFFYERGFYDG